MVFTTNFTVCVVKVTPPMQAGGPRTFTAYLEYENFNQTATGDGGEFRSALRAYGNYAVIKEISLTYTAAASGQRVTVQITPATAQYAVIEEEIVTNAPDYDTFSWPGLYIPLFLESTPANTVTVVVRDYAATDDIRLVVSGEVW